MQQPLSCFLWNTGDLRTETDRLRRKETNETDGEKNKNVLVCGTHQSLYEARLLCFSQRGDGVVEEHGEQLWAEPLLLAPAAAAGGAAAGPHYRGLCQGQHPERRVDGKNGPENTHILSNSCTRAAEDTVQHLFSHVQAEDVGGRVTTLNECVCVSHPIYVRTQRTTCDSWL